MNRLVNLILLVLVLSAAVFPCHYGQVYGAALSDFKTDQGISNLANETSKPGEQRVSLEGEWEFYWHQLLTPDDLRNNEARPSYIQVPAPWDGQVVQGMLLRNHGYGTYRLQLKLSPADVGKSKALYFKYIGSAYQVWIDNVLKSQLGVVADASGKETPRAHINLVFFEPEQTTVEVIIQVSNFSFREGGIISEVLYGDTKALISYNLKKLFVDIFFIGGFFIIGLYHLIIYRIRKMQLSALFVGLFALAIATRTLFLNEYLVLILLRIDDWEVMTRIEYLSEVAAFLFLILLMKQMYPREVHRTMVYMSFIAAALFSGYIVLTPTRIFTETMFIQVAIFVSIILYFVFYVGITASLRKREGALINIIAIIIIVLGVCNDTLYHLRMIDSVEIIDYCVFVFILLQGIIVSYRFSLLFDKNDQLTKEMVEWNATLEQKVNDRTDELNTMNRELAQMNQVRTKTLANVAHDLGSPAVGVQTYLQLMKTGKLQAGDPEVMQQLIDKTAYIKRLIDDLFELSKLESKELSFQFEQVMAKTFIRDAFYKLEPDLKQEKRILRLEKLETTLDGKEAFIRIDPFRIMQVLHNYVGNAVKFTNAEDNTVTMNGYIVDRRFPAGSAYMLCVEIADQGIGLSANELPQVFHRFYKKRNGNEGGSGLGLAISKEIIEQHSGKVGVESKVGKGSSFNFSLPIIFKD